MSDRLQELLHQKALLSEHAEWLEREIALERARSARPPAAPAATVSATQNEASAPLAPTPSAPAPVAAADLAEAIPGGYRPEPKSIRQAVTWGCMLYFIAAVVLLGLGVAAIFWFYRHR